MGVDGQANHDEALLRILEDPKTDPGRSLEQVFEWLDEHGAGNIKPERILASGLSLIREARVQGAGALETSRRYTALWRRIAQLQLAMGEVALAQTSGELGASHATMFDPESAQLNLVRLRCAMISGHGVVAEALFRTLDAHALPRSVDQERDRLYIRTLRNANRADAILFAHHCQTKHTDQDGFHWEQLKAETLLSGDLRPVIAAVRRGRRHHRPLPQLQAALLAMAHPQSRWGSTLPKPKAMAERAHRDGEGTPSFLAGVKFLSLLQDHDESLPLAELYFKASAMLPIPDPELQLFCLAALTRKMADGENRELAARALQDWQQYCRGLSHQRWHDIGNLFGDLTFEGLLTAKDPVREMSALVAAATRTVPINRLQRSLQAFQLVRSLKKASAQSDPDSESMRELGERLVQLLSNLRGPLMKLGQVLSYAAPALPEEIRGALSRLQLASIAMPVDAVKTRLAKAWQQPVGAVLRELRATPMGAGSIAQVHMGELRDGQRVAIKVRYAGVSKAVRSDMKNLRMATPVLRRVWSQIDWQAIFHEIEVGMSEEVDLQIEASHMRHASQIFVGDEDVIIPQVFDNLSNSNVLVQSAEHGLSFQEFVRRADQKERDRVGEIIFRTFCKSIYEYGFFNTDPHPGNYLIQDGRVVFLDWGCVKKWSPEFLQLWSRVVCSALRDDYDGFAEVWQQGGFAASPDVVPGQWEFVKTFVVGRYSRDEVRPFITVEERNRLREALSRSEAAHQIRLPTEMLFSLRYMLGINAVLFELGAQCNWHRIFLTILEHSLSKRGATDLLAG